MGQTLEAAEGYLLAQIAQGCGGDQCIAIVTFAAGNTDPAGRTGCVTLVVDVPGNVWEDDGFEGQIPVLYIRRGGVLRLGIELQCDESAGGGSEGGEGQPGGTATSDSTTSAVTP